MAENQEIVAITRKELEAMISDAVTRALPGIVNLTLELAKNKIRKFVILMDYENFEKNREIPDELIDISWLTNAIFEENGQIEKIFVFLPEHLRAYPPIISLSNIHRAFPIICPKDNKKYIGERAEDIGVKDTDTVDARMDELGTWLIDHCPDVTDVVLITGDKGFQKLLKHAEYRGKKVWLVSAVDALAMRFSLQRFNTNLKFVLVE